MAFASPPFSTSEIFKKLFPMIRVVPREMSEHAIIEVYDIPTDEIRATVAYRENAHHSTHRFSCAHELAHWLFDFDEGRKLTNVPACHGGRGEKPVHERRADHFAAELLVPLHVLDGYIDFLLQYDDDNEDADLEFRGGAQRLASRFNVSLFCMQARLRDLQHWRKLAHGRAFSRR
jgi:Zn-dependent peptidase ImmA (M78 family)